MNNNEIKLQDIHIGFIYEELVQDPSRYFNQGQIWITKRYGLKSPRLYKMKKLINDGLIRNPVNENTEFKTYEIEVIDKPFIEIPKDIDMNPKKSESLFEFVVFSVLWIIGILVFIFLFVNFINSIFSNIQ